MSESQVDHMKVPRWRLLVRLSRAYNLIGRTKKTVGERVIATGFYRSRRSQCEWFSARTTKLLPPNLAFSKNRHDWCSQQKSFLFGFSTYQRAYLPILSLKTRRTVEKSLLGHNKVPFGAGSRLYGTHHRIWLWVRKTSVSSESDQFYSSKLVYKAFGMRWIRKYY